MDENQTNPSVQPKEPVAAAPNNPSVQSEATPPIAPQPTQSNQSPAQNTTPGEKPSPSTGKTVATILLLLTIWPIGLILMFVWMKWPVWVKVLLTAFYIVLLPLMFIFFAAALVAVNPAGALKKAECVGQCETATDPNICVQECLGEDFMMEDSIEYEVESDF